MAEAKETAMSGEHRRILRNKRPTLEPDLQAKQLLPYLSEILNAEDEEDIRAEKTPTEQARRLLDILPRKGPTAFECFVNALWKTQPHLASFLSKEAGLSEPNDYNATEKRIMPTEIRNKLRNSEFREKLRHVNFKRILKLMKGVLTTPDYQLIESQTTQDAMIEEFLSILPKKGMSVYDHFLEVLDSREFKSIHDFLKGTTSREDKLENTHKKPLTRHPEYQTPVSQIKDHLASFYAITNEDESWKKLTQELQLPQQNYIDNLNPTHAVIEDWTAQQGDMANVSVLKQALQRQGLTHSLSCLENVLSSNGDAIDAPSKITYITERTQNLQVSIPAKEISPVPVPKMLHDLNPAIVQNLKDQITLEIKQNSNLESITFCKENCPIREITRLLREKNLKETIKWMKENLPAGVTGPLLADNMNVRDMPYRVRSKLTIELTTGGNWKWLAGRLGIDNTRINFFNERFPNPADEVLKHWETKRNSTIGEFYNILVELEMPVIADIL